MHPNCLSEFKQLFSLSQNLHTMAHGPHLSHGHVFLWPSHCLEMFLISCQHLQVGTFHIKIARLWEPRDKSNDRNAQALHFCSQLSRRRTAVELCVPRRGRRGPCHCECFIPALCSKLTAQSGMCICEVWSHGTQNV